MPISNKRELHCVRADVFGDLKIYVSEALARFARPRIKISYFFSVGTFGGLAPPPPNTKKLATLVMTIICVRTRRKAASYEPRIAILGIWG